MMWQYAWHSYLFISVMLTRSNAGSDKNVPVMFPNVVSHAFCSLVNKLVVELFHCLCSFEAFQEQHTIMILFLKINRTHLNIQLLVFWIMDQETERFLPHWADRILNGLKYIKTI